jgi:hypothetical protein
MKLTVIWPDGTVNTGKSWQDIESSIRSAQWQAHGDRAAFRMDMRHRCKVWSGVRPDIVKATSEDFIKALEASGLCRVEIEGTK